MKLIFNLLVVLWGSSLLIGCDLDKSLDSTGEIKSVTTEGGQSVINELEAFIATDDRETITLTKEDAGKILSILRPKPKSDLASPASSTPVKRVSKATASEIETKPVMSEAKSNEMAARTAVKDSAEVPAAKGDGSAKKEKPKAVAVSKEPKGVSDQLPDSDTACPEGYAETLVDPTTGSEFKWSAKKSVWISEAFGDYLKGSSKQNDSFCWILTQNSSGVDKGAIPAGWRYFSLSDRKSVVIAEKSRGAEILASVGKLGALPKSVVDVKSEKINSVPESESEVKNGGEMLSGAAATETKAAEKTPEQTSVPAVAETKVVAAMPASAASSPAEPKKEKAATAAPSNTESGRVAVTPPAPTSSMPVDEPARVRPVSQLLPMGATLPDGRRLLAIPQYETRRYVNPEQPAARPALRAVPARKVDSLVQGQDTTAQPAVPSAKSKPVKGKTWTFQRGRGRIRFEGEQEKPAQPQPVPPKQ